MGVGREQERQSTSARRILILPQTYHTHTRTHAHTPSTRAGRERGGRERGKNGVVEGERKKNKQNQSGTHERSKPQTQERERDTARDASLQRYVGPMLEEKRKHRAVMRHGISPLSRFSFFLSALLSILLTCAIDTYFSVSLSQSLSTAYTHTHTHTHSLIILKATLRRMAYMTRKNQARKRRASSRERMKE